MSLDLLESVGAVHLHSTFSDGARSIPEIAGIAARKGLDFLMFTDHNTLEPKRQGLEGWYDSVLVLIGYEINLRSHTSGPINAIFFDWIHGSFWGGSSNHGEDYGVAW